MEILDVNPTSKSVAEKKTINAIRSRNGIDYAPEFTSDGLKIPIPFFDGYGSCPYLLLIPKSELIAMLREYLPEIIEEIRSNVIKELWGSDEKE